jgi:hypothetical protein
MIAGEVGTTKIVVESDIVPGHTKMRHVVRLYVDGVSLVTETDTAEQARALVLRLAQSLGMRVEPE